MSSLKIFNAFTVMYVSLLSHVCAEVPTWINIFRNEGDKQRVTAIPIDSVSNIYFGQTAGGNDYFNVLSVKKIDGGKSDILMDDVVSYTFGDNVPTIHITTDPEVAEITSKKDYLPASLSMEAYGRYDDVQSVDVNIRGRGNSTWTFSKKPYRLKFDKKISLCGLKKAKSYVLVANYLDNTLMKNAIAFKIGELLGMPYTNHSIPVNVVLNGVYRGSYMLSEKVGINAGSVDIDEEKAIMWELDAYFDEDYKFKSKLYSLPVMVKDPDLSEIAVPAEGQTQAEAAWELLGMWRSDFEKMEASVRAGTPGQFLDIEQAVNYMLANNVVRNNELNWPKSVYLFKEEESSSYKLGPLWDYDWAFNFLNQSYDWPLLTFQGYDKFGTSFFMDLVKSDAFKSAFEEKWIRFKNEQFPVLLEYIDSYSDAVRVSALQDGERWPDKGPDGQGYSCETFDRDVQELKDWLTHRVEFIDRDSNHGFY